MVNNINVLHATSTRKYTYCKTLSWLMVIDADMAEMDHKRLP